MRVIPGDFSTLLRLFFTFQHCLLINAITTPLFCSFFEYRSKTCQILWDYLDQIYFPDCSTPPNPVNGNVTVTGTDVNSTATIFCHTGYHLVGVSSITCMADGNWSSTNYSCHVVGM